MWMRGDPAISRMWTISVSAFDKKGDGTSPLRKPVM
jgi:hypothetical protein